MYTAIHTISLPFSNALINPVGSTFQRISGLASRAVGQVQTSHNATIAVIVVANFALLYLGGKIAERFDGSRQQPNENGVGRRILFGAPVAGAVQAAGNYALSRMLPGIMSRAVILALTVSALAYRVLSIVNAYSTQRQIDEANKKANEKVDDKLVRSIEEAVTKKNETADSKIEVQLNTLLAEMKKAEAEISDLKQKLALAEKDFNDQTDELKAELVVSRDKEGKFLIDLEANIQKFDQVRVHLGKELAERHDEIKKLKVQLSDLEKKNGELQQKLTHQTPVENEELLQKLTQKQKDYEGLEHALANAIKEHEESNGKYLAALDASTQMQLNHQFELKKIEQDHQQSISQLTSQLNVLRGEIEHEEKKYNELGVKCIQYQEMIALLKRENGELTDAIEALQIRLDQAHSDLDRASAPGKEKHVEEHGTPSFDRKQSRVQEEDARSPDEFDSIAVDSDAKSSPDVKTPKRRKSVTEKFVSKVTKMASFGAHEGTENKQPAAATGVSPQTAKSAEGSSAEKLKKGNSFFG